MAEWISVKDRLPKETGYYLICLYYPQFEIFDIRSNEVTIAYYTMYDNLFCTDLNGAYNADISKVDTTGYHEYVTHWAPLPEPPKEANNG